MKKTILITGSNGNLAKTMISYLKKDYDIVGCDISSNNVNNLKEFFIVDLSNELSIKSFLKDLIDKSIDPDIIINNAALDSVPKSEESSNGLEYFNFENLFNVNVKAPLIISEFFINKWILNNVNGRIINITSIYSIVSPDPEIYQSGFIKNILYGSSKSALNSITKQLAVIYSKNNIQINGIAFGGVESVSHHNDFEKKYIKRIPIKRFMKPKEILSGIKFLLDENNTYTNGSIICIDGAYTCI